MITLINNLIAPLPNARNEDYQTHWMFHHGINPLPSWTVNWLDERVPVNSASGSATPAKRKSKGMTNHAEAA